MATESTKAKNDFGTDHRTPLASASCFTAQLTSVAQRVAVAMNHRFSATAPNAQGLCQTHSVSLNVRLYCIGQKEETRPFCTSAVHDNIIHPTDGHGDRNTSVDMSQSTASICWCTLWEVRGEGVYLLTAIRWISSRALKCPFIRSGENESWRKISPSFPQGRWCLATF